MNVKRILLSVLTLVALIPVIVSLVASINQPQVQSNLQLYQTNIILQASEFQGKTSLGSDDELANFRTALLGKDPYLMAQNQYREARQLSEKNLANLTEQINSISSPSAETEDNETNINIFKISKQGLKSDVETQIKQEKESINQLSLKLGIIQAVRGETQKAIALWQDLANNPQVSDGIVSTANILTSLWSKPTQIIPETDVILTDNLKGWFRYKSLQKFYQIQKQQKSLSNLEDKEQAIAYQSLIKIISIFIIPLLFGIIGLGLLIYLIVQLFVQKKEAILIFNNDFAWQTPWDVETIWQVLIIGFLLLGQILLPLLFGVVWGFLKINPVEFDLRDKAFYILVSYLTMTGGGILVLYLSIKSFLPLPKDWFSFRWLSNWILWGLGGYVVSIPLVITVSLINQQIWQGQGGSNPLLTLALEAQDQVVLTIFLITATIAAPFFEEIMFRGFLLPSLTRYLPVWGAIGVSSLVFAFAHLNVSEVIPLATLGMVLGVVYTRSRNLLSSMLLHSLWNGGTLFSLFILGSSNG